ncbi:MAG TPA: serine/threonine-protein kinase, partial [bacterium]|nr:serine/threonine-protein kinase [bacterium]
MATFGRYTLIRRVGLGGMAEIWKAKVLGPAGFEKTVAVKKILPELTDDSEFLEMFVDEAKLVADLVHPNIVQVHDFGQVGPRDYFIAMEYVSGANLGSLLKRLKDRGARVPRETAIFIILESARGLGYAHAKRDSAGRSLGIVHRDVSPSNILVSFGGEVKVADFGIAKARSARQTTAEGFVRGKVSYMSPEQAAGGDLDQRSDIFSLGLVFVEMLTGKRFFTGENSRDIYQK